MNEFIEKKSENIVEDIINEVEKRISDDYNDAICPVINLYEGIDDIALSEKKLEKIQKFYALIAKRNRKKEKRKERILQNEENIRIIVKPVAEIPKEDLISGEGGIIQQIALRNMQKEKEIIEIPKEETREEKILRIKAEQKRIKKIEREQKRIKREQELKTLLEASKAEQEKEIEELKLELEEKLKKQTEKKAEQKAIIRATATIIAEQLEIIAAAKKKVAEQNEIIRAAKEIIIEQNLIETRIIEIRTEIKAIAQAIKEQEQAELIIKIKQREQAIIKGQEIEIERKQKGKHYYEAIKAEQEALLEKLKSEIRRQREQAKLMEQKPKDKLEKIKELMEKLYE